MIVPNSVFRRRVANYEPSNTNDIKNDIQTQLRICYEYLLVSAVFVLLLRLSLYGSVPNYFPFVILIIYQLTWFWRTAISFIKSNEIHEKEYLKKQITYTILTLVLYMLLVLYKINHLKSIVLVTIPIITSCMISVFSKTHLISKCKKYAQRIEIFYRWILALSLLFASLKEINTINASYLFIFWPIWLMVFILCIIGILEILYTIKLFCQRNNNRNNYDKFIGPLWIASLTIGSGLTIGYVFFKISISTQDNMVSNIYDALLVLLLYLIASSLESFLITRLLQ